MPFPWKKAKVIRISRLVADLHQSPKCGGSLVVETGFPTSLIDLFVKNRDRLRKPSKRKSYSNPHIQTTLSNQPSSPPESSHSPPCKDLPPPLSPEIGDGSLVVLGTESEKMISFRTAFKNFLAVALAVSTRNLAVRIMMVAVLLVVIEFVGRRYFLKPESKIVFLESWVRKSLVLKRLDWRERQSEQEIVVESCGLIELKDYCLDEIEIEIAESEIDPIDKVCKTETQSEMQEEKEKRGKMLISKSGRARIKANLIKKLVPRKIRNGKKQGKSKKQDELEDKVGIAKETEAEENIKIPDQISREKVDNESKGKKSGYLILVVIVLSGLVGGKGVALLLTLLCCLMVRYIGRWRY